MGEEQNGHGKSRLDRLEGLMELLIDDHLKFTDEHRRLLTAQILLTEAQQRTESKIEELAEAQKHTEKKIEELAEAQKHTDERLNALITVVDGIVRRNPGPSP
jgi:hypothetical protein